jgi:hypothetical protein
VFAIAVELGTGFIDNQCAPAVDRTVQRANSILGLSIIRHLDERKSARLTGVAIRDNRDGLNCSVGPEYA